MTQPTIEQVIAAWSAVRPREVMLQVYQDENDGKWRVEPGYLSSGQWNASTAREADAVADALRQLYDDAVATLRGRHREAQAILEKLGVEP